MSYCVNCGVELESAARECPLCNTPVWNPREQGTERNADGSFPVKKGQVETVKRKDFGLLISMVLLATAVTCGVLNAFVFRENLWSLAVIGACGILWVMVIPAVIYAAQSVYVSLLYDGAAVAFYLFLLTFLTESRGWFTGLGLPIVILLTVLAECFTFCVRKLPKSFLTISLYLFTAIGLVCIGLEILIDRYVFGEISPGWSAVVLTVCVILDIAIVTLLSRKRLRNAVRRRLHF